MEFLNRYWSIRPHMWAPPLTHPLLHLLHNPFRGNSQALISVNIMDE